MDKLTPELRARIEAKRQEALERKRKFEQTAACQFDLGALSDEGKQKGQHQNACCKRPRAPIASSASSSSSPGASCASAQRPQSHAMRNSSSPPALQEAPAAPSLNDLPPRLHEALMPFQRDGVQFGIEQQGRCLIGDEMGLGKTLQAISLAWIFKSDWPVLCLMPASMRWVWAEELEKWLPELRPGHVKVVSKGDDTDFGDAKFVLVTFDLLVRCEELRKVILSRGFKMMIVDESHYCKDGRAQRTKHVSALAAKVRRCVLLSGTPALNRPIELFSQIDMVRKGHFQWKYYTERFCGARQVFGRWEFKGAKNLHELNQSLVSIMIRRRKADVLTQLPAKRRQMVPIELSDQSVAKRLEKQYNTWRQMQRSFERDQMWSACMQETAEAKAPHAAEYVMDLIEGGAKVLVFGHYEKTLDAIVTHLTRKNCQHIRIDGKMLVQDRIDAVRRFQDNAEVRAAVLSVTAAGQGITLTSANTVVFAELRSTPGEMQQAEDRAHRIGQVEKVSVHYLVALRTLDETLWSMVGHKIDKVAQALDGQREKYNAENVGEGCTGSFEATGDFRPDMCQPNNSKLEAFRPGQATGIAAYFQPKVADGTVGSGGDLSRNVCGSRRVDNVTSPKHSVVSKEDALAAGSGEGRRAGSQEEAVGGACELATGARTEQEDGESDGQGGPTPRSCNVIDLAGDEEEEQTASSIQTPPSSQGEREDHGQAWCVSRSEAARRTPEQTRVICLVSDESSNESGAGTWASHGAASHSENISVSSDNCKTSATDSVSSASHHVDFGRDVPMLIEIDCSKGSMTGGGQRIVASPSEQRSSGERVEDCEGRLEPAGGKRETVWIQASLNTQRMFVYADSARNELIGRGKPAALANMDEMTGDELGDGEGKEAEGRRKRWVVKVVREFAKEWMKLRAVEQRKLGNMMVAVPPTLSPAGAMQA